MKFSDFFKKKEIEKSKEIKKEVKSPKVKVAEKIKKSASAPAGATADKAEKKPEIAKAKIGTLDIAHCVLKEPHISEKSTDLVEKDQYTFKVWPRANKNEIKKSVEDIYPVNVVGVKIIKIPRRKRRMGKITGWKSGYKKAIVKIKKGQKIEVLPR